MKNKLWKKIALTSLSLTLGTTLVGCSCDKSETEPNIATFTRLTNDKVLYVEDEAFFNFKNTEIEKEYLTYIVSTNYTLERSSYSLTDAIYYNGNYYRWNVQHSYEESYLGEKVTTNQVEYQYLQYGQDNDLVLKETRTRTVTHKYDGGWIEKNFEYSINLSNYFTSYAILEATLPELAKQIDTTGKKRYYVDVTTPQEVDVGVEHYNTYYYIENL